MASSAPDRTDRAPADVAQPRIRELPPVGIVGCGAVTRATVDLLLGTGARVAWIVDPDSEARAAVAGQLAVSQAAPRQFADVAEALRAERSPSPVIINSPGSLHLDHIELAAAARRPMLVAKPLAMDWDGVRRALDFAHAAGVAIAVAEQYPDEPHARQIRALIDAHGPVRRATFDHRKPRSGQGTLAGKSETGILEYAVHHYAVLAAWLDDLPTSIAVDTWTSDSGRSGNGSIGHSWIHYEDSHVLHAFGFGGARPTYRAELDLDGGTVTASGSHFTAPDVTTQIAFEGSSIPAYVASDLPPAPAWATLFDRWLDSPAWTTPAADRRGILIVAAMVDAALRSATTGTVVQIAADRRYAEAR